VKQAYCALLSTLSCSLSGLLLPQNDMMTVNENAGTASNANRFLYRTHEESGKACVSVVDLVTGATAKWGPMDGFSSFDGIEWCVFQLQ
jgi:hypothetical protein